MILAIQKYFSNKHHSLEEITFELFKKNKLKKTVFFNSFIVIYIITMLFSAHLYTIGYISIPIFFKIVYSFLIVFILSSLLLLPYHPFHYGFNFKRKKFNTILGLKIGIIF